LVKGNVDLLNEHRGHGYLLAHLRNLPETKHLYEEICFVNGSRGRGNGKTKTSPLAGSNIWLATEDECVVICQIDKGRGPLKVVAYSSGNGVRTLHDSVRQIIEQYDLPHYLPDSG